MPAPCVKTYSTPIIEQKTLRRPHYHPFSEQTHTQGNPANNEYNYAGLLWAAFSSASPGFDPHFVIDTGRNGVSDMRSSCSNWCNIRGAGVGAFPTTSTEGGGLVDALFWLKTPGESDGCTALLPLATDPMVPDGACPRFDAMCASADSIGGQEGEPFCPEAGAWFDYEVKMLGANAVWGVGGDV